MLETGGGCEIPPFYVKRFEYPEKRYINVTNYYNYYLYYYIALIVRKNKDSCINLITCIY